MIVLALWVVWLLSMLGGPGINEDSMIRSLPVPDETHAEPSPVQEPARWVQTP